MGSNGLEPSLGAMSEIFLWESMQWKNLPSVRDLPDEDQRRGLFIYKLNLCEERMDFSEQQADFERKELKRRTLVELADYLSSAGGELTAEAYEQLINTVSANIFRALPIKQEYEDYNDPDDEDPELEPAWQHIQIIYELLRRFIVSHDTDARILRDYINEGFLLQLLDLFDSEDPREREYLKTILHRIYGKMMPLRSFIRKSITFVFHRYIYELQKFNGIAELLEILGSIINGFALPLREEHKQFLRKALIPLHIPQGLPRYYVQLSFCVTQFVEKDATLAVDVIRGLCKYWPVSYSRKEVMYLNELEELLELVDPEEVSSILDLLFRRIASCISSQHFQVAERALFFWNNEYIVNLIVHHRNIIVPIVFPALQRNSQGHWNRNVNTLSFNVQKLLAEMDGQLFSDCLLSYENKQVVQDEEERKRRELWDSVEHDWETNRVDSRSQNSLRLSTDEDRRADGSAQNERDQNGGRESDSDAGQLESISGSAGGRSHGRNSIHGDGLIDIPKESEKDGEAAEGQGDTHLPRVNSEGDSTDLNKLENGRDRGG